MRPETSTKMTYEDLLLLLPDGLRHEIIEGEHYENASLVRGTNEFRTFAD